MKEWLADVIGAGSGGLLGYYLRGLVDDRFARRKEGRDEKQADIRALRDSLIEFLGDPRAHFSWLQNVRNPSTAGGVPSPSEKAQMIAGWVYKNAMRYPKNRRGSMYLIANVTYQLARDDRHFLEQNPQGEEAIEAAWDSLDEYAQELTSRLHNAD
jgi:hypothetical protein